MLHRFFAPDLAADGSAVRLPREEARHLAQVLRLGVGDLVRLFDGRGRECVGRVAAARRLFVDVEPVEPVEPLPEPAVSVTLEQAVVRSERMDAIVRDATMLGVAGIQPIVASRTSQSPGSLERRGSRARWQRIALASVKQCGRAVLPEVHPIRAARDVLASRNDSLRLILVEPGADANAACDPASLGGGATPASARIAIGPEGGWAPEELALARQSGYIPVTLGKRTLRADAAAVVALAVLQFVWGDLR